MALTFYVDDLSQPCRAVNMFLQMNKVEHTRKETLLSKGEHKSPECMKVNPFGALPAISHGDFNLGDSLAILKYLQRVYKLPDHWYPSDAKKQANTDAYLGWHTTAIRQHGTTIFLAVGMEKFFGSPFGQEEKVAESKKSLGNNLSKLETIFLTDTDFISSTEMTIADLLCVNELMQPMMVKYDIPGTHPKVFEYILRVRSAVGTDIFDTILKPYFAQMGTEYFA